MALYLGAIPVADLQTTFGRRYRDLIANKFVSIWAAPRALRLILGQQCLANSADRTIAMCGSEVL